MNITATIFVFGIYFVLCILLLSRLISVFMNKYDRITDDEVLDILHSPFIPKISVILTNEAVVSVERIFSLMALQYGNYELILVMDKGNPLIKELRKEFLLVREHHRAAAIPVKENGLVYRSDRPGFRKLYVIEKAESCIGDCLNAGLNVSSGQYLCLLTRPASLSRDSLIKLLKPFLERHGDLSASSAAVRIRPVVPEKSSGALWNIRNFVLYGGGSNIGLPIEAFCAGTGMLSRKDVILAGGFSPNVKDPVRMLLYHLASEKHVRPDKHRMVYVPEVLVQPDSEYGVKYGILDQLKCYVQLVKKRFDLKRSLLMIPVVFPGIVYFMHIVLMLLLVITAPGTSGISLQGSIAYFIAGYTFLVASSLLALFVEIRFSTLSYSRNEIRKLVAASFVFPFRFHVPGKS